MNQRPLKVGVLCPASSNYPTLPQDFMDGIYCALTPQQQREIQLIPEFVHLGQQGPVGQAIDKFLFFDRMDFLTGFVGYQIIPYFLNKLEQQQKIALFADIGEYLPFLENKSDFVFYNSFQYWQGEYALGKWAQENYGGVGATLMTLYEAGYHMHQAFHIGVGQGGGSEIDMTIIKHNAQNHGELAHHLEAYFEKLKKEQPSYLHALFSGQEAMDFFDQFYKSGLHKTLPLVVSPHMASDEILIHLKDLDLKFHSASLWKHTDETKGNKQFKSRLWSFNQQTIPNIYHLLGYEIGLIVSELFQKFKAQKLDEIIAYLKKKTIFTPRGERNFYQNSSYALPEIFIEKVTIDKGTFHHWILEKGARKPYTEDIYRSIKEENVSGFINPYMCV